MYNFLEPPKNIDILYSKNYVLKMTINTDNYNYIKYYNIYIGYKLEIIFEWKCFKC